MRPRQGAWIKVNVDGRGLCIMSAALDEALGHPPAVGWDVRNGLLTIWWAQPTAYQAVRVSRPWRGRVRQFRCRNLAHIPFAKLSCQRSSFEPRWFIAKLGG